MSPAAVVVGVTISLEQMEWAQHSCQGLPVEIRLQDYRDVTGGFDRVASLGMFEHVGYKNYRKFFEVARRGCVLAASFISLPSGPIALRVPPILGSTDTFFRIRICRRPRKLRQGWRACLSLKIGRTGQLRPQDCGLVSELSKALEKPANPATGNGFVGCGSST